MMERYVLLRLKTRTRVARAGGRTLRHESRYGNLHAVPLVDALRLVDGGEAKLASQFKIAILRAEVAELEAA